MRWQRFRRGGVAGLLIALGVMGAGEVLAEPRFADVTEAVGLKIGKQQGSWGDVNQDGWSDLVIGGQVWLNRQGESFYQLETETGMSRQGGPAVLADFNGDGRLDAYLIARGGALWLGDGTGRFSLGQADKNPAGAIQAAAAADLDQDGWLDLYIANYEIWKEQRDFPDLILANREGALVQQWSAPPEKQMRGRGVTCCDFNQDGRIDVYVSNYRLMPNFLWVNHGAWDLRDEARELGCAGSERRQVAFKNSLGIVYYSSGHTIGSVWGDFNGDALFDLFVGNFSHPPAYQDRPQLLLNGGPGRQYRFLDCSLAAGIPWQESYGSPAAGDVDNDGWLDLFYTTCYAGDSGRLFRNLGSWAGVGGEGNAVATGPLFADVTASSGLVSKQNYQNAFADFDQDGRLDLLTGGRLYRNVTETSGSWLLVSVAADGANRSAVGAVVTAEAEGVRVVRQVEAGTGNANQHDLRLHFGLGRCRGPVELSVRWPDGRRSRQSSAVNRQVTLVSPPAVPAE